MNEDMSRRMVLAFGAVAAGQLCLGNTRAAESKRRVLVWSEGTAPKNVYPMNLPIRPTRNRQTSSRTTANHALFQP